MRLWWKIYKEENKVKLAKIDWVRVNSYYSLMVLFFFLSSPFLFVFGDDHVTCHVGAYVDTSEHTDHRDKVGQSLEEFLFMFYVQTFYNKFL